jgi:hypothetical protein
MKNLKAEVARHRVKIPRSVDFGAYLESHPDLADIVPSVCAQARQEFGKHSELILQVYRNPEIDDRHLSLIVRLPSYDGNIMQRLDRVTEPFEEELCSASGYLLVTTDFRPSKALAPGCSSSLTSPRLSP